MKSSWEWYRGMISLVLSCTRTHPEGDGQAELTRVFLLFDPFVFRRELPTMRL